MAKAAMRKTSPRRAIASDARRPAEKARAGGLTLGVLTAWDERGPVVDFDDQRGVVARVSGSAPGAGVRAPGPVTPGQEVELMMDPRPGRPPILLGFLRAPGGAGELDARVDGKRVEIEGRDEIVLRCGQASITLRRNGRIVVRGVDIDTHASGTNRIKGGSVSIN
jgi:hypothetical protein